MMRRAGWLAVVLAIAASGYSQTTMAGAATDATVRYEMKLSDLKYVYGVAPPVMHLHSGDTLETTTADADGHTLMDAGMKVMGRTRSLGRFTLTAQSRGIRWRSTSSA